MQHLTRHHDAAPEGVYLFLWSVVGGDGSGICGYCEGSTPYRRVPKPSHIRYCSETRYLLPGATAIGLMGSNMG
jgi:hypothetical protein